MTNLQKTRLEEHLSQFETLLSSIKGESGKLFYSAAETLSPGQFYFLGTNPGGKSIDRDGNPAETIEKSLNGLPGRTKNDFLDESWKGKPRGNAPLQLAAIKLFAELGHSDIRKICASNLIFVRSENLKHLEHFNELADICWQVHEVVISEIVKPKVILVHGNGNSGSPFSYISQLQNQREEDWDTFPSGHGKMVCKWFDTSINGHSCRVIGLPHLSRFTLKTYEEIRALTSA